jgi:ribonucleoside-diphosphate reductase alpha chain
MAIEEQKTAMVSIPRETLEFFGGDELRARVFYEKYTLRDEKGSVLERSPKEMWRRVADVMAGAEASEQKRIEWSEKFFWMLDQFRFIPGGRILFGAGQKRKVTLLNCYVVPVKEDTIDAIFGWCREAAKTYSYGGGVGTDISVLRPKNSVVHNAAIKSTGAVSFMNIMSETTGTIGQAGRRGALMITIRVDHPDIVDFIRVKRNLKSVRYANISIRITDQFMNAVENDTDFTLWYENEVVGRIERKVRARDLWGEIIESARDWAEPGLIFWDNVVRGSPSEYNGMNVVTTNPCSEQPLQPYGACDLGHVNLPVFVVDPFTNRARVDWENLEKTIRYGVRFLDNVLTYNEPKHALREQAEASRSSRRIGLGFNGLGDMLLKMMIKYDTDQALSFVDELMEKMKNIAYDESTEIAKEKGAFPLFDAEKHLSMPFVKTLGKELQEKIRTNGLRNVAILTIAPVGSGAALAGTSSGMEPVFAFSYTRRSESLSKEFFKVYHPVVSQYMSLYGIDSEEKLPEFFVPAHKIRPEFRVRMQGTVQKHVDSAISSTVNLAAETTPAQVGEIYMQAWKAGCKGITVYREGSREGILITEEQEKRQRKEPEEWERPRVMEGKTIVYKIHSGSLYVTVGMEDGKPKEVFVTLGKSGTNEKSYTEAIGRLVSLYLQMGGDGNDIIRSLKGIHGRDATWDHGVQLLSVPDAIAKAIEAVTNPSRQALITEQQEHRQEGLEAKTMVKDGKLGMDECPKCGEYAMRSENGCETCMMCGYSKCS